MFTLCNVLLLLSDHTDRPMRSNTSKRTWDGVSRENEKEIDQLVMVFTKTCKDVSTSIFLYNKDKHLFKHNQD